MGARAGELETEGIVEFKMRRDKVILLLMLRATVVSPTVVLFYTCKLTKQNRCLTIASRSSRTHGALPLSRMARVRPARDEIGMEGREGAGEHVRRRVEHVLGPIDHVQIPHADDAVGIRDGHRIAIVRGERQFGELSDQRRGGSRRGGPWVTGRRS